VKRFLEHEKKKSLSLSVRNNCIFVICYWSISCECWVWGGGGGGNNPLQYFELRLQYQFQPLAVNLTYCNFKTADADIFEMRSAYGQYKLNTYTTIQKIGVVRFYFFLNNSYLGRMHSKDI